MLMTETYPTGALANATTTSNNTLDNDSDGYSERLRLKIQPQPPKFPFRDHPFELTVYMVDPSDHLKSGLTVPLNVELYSAEKMTPIEKQILHVDPSTKPVINGDGICKLRLRISECSMAMGNRKFVVHISASKQAGSDLNVAPAVTSEMTVIQHRLVIQENLPDLWYKDEGGRDKCMTLPIYLVNEKNERVQNRQVPLRVTLLYENEHPVLKQDILKMSPDCQRLIDNSGKAMLKLRIEDVSKNHQGQAFRLKVEADTAQSPMNFDVAFDLSSTISVRSKRNKRRPLKPSGMSITHHIIAGASNPASATSSPSSNPDTEAALSLGGFPSDERESKRMRLSPSTGSSSQMASSGGQKTASLTGSMESILSWTGAVVNGLQQLEWQNVGYESKTDGTADPERPIYRCPACWRYKDTMTYDTAQHDTKCLIANLLLAYMTDTVGHLDYVLKSIEQFPAMLAAQKSGKMGDGSNGPSLVSPQHLNGLGDHPSTPQMMTSVMMSQAMVSSASGGHFAMTAPISSAPPSLTRGLTEMIGGMEAPTLMRGNSGGLSEFMRSLDDNGESSGMYFQNIANQSQTSSSQVADAIEMQVSYVLARMITLNGTNPIGFPAFDSNLNLLGFYQEGRENATTEVMFVPVSDITAITQNEIGQTQRLLRTEIKEGSNAVHTLARCNNDLVKLKEDVILFHWNAKDRSVQQQQQQAW